MAKLDWRGWITQARGRARRVPRWVWAATGVGVVAAGLLIAVASDGPPYTPLDEGLSARQGGQVIEQLQKLGIPYALNSSGSIISVPAPDLARARLQLGKLGVPTASGSEAWSQLTQGSLTRGRDAIDALQKRALESSLEKGIDGISGIASSRVNLALPASTPFLGDQPKPKASVWLHTVGAGITATQARAIAQMVASSVPGLALSRVTVTDQNGDLLAPIKATGYGRAQQELAFRNQIERATAAHVNALLEPLVGAHNFRVSTSALVDFDESDTQATRFGPAHIAAHLKRTTKQREGSDSVAQGVPGALSNEPPENASATPAANSAPAGRPAGAAAAGPAQALPRSASSTLDVTYDVDRQTTVSHGAPWHLQALSVSVVLNEAVARADPRLLAKVRTIVTGAISAPGLKVNVAAVPFGLEHTSTARRGLTAMLANPALFRSLLALLAVLFVLLGIAVPLARWLGRVNLSLRRRPRPLPADDFPPPERPTAAQRAATDKLRRSTRLASEKPKDAAELVKRWLAEPAARHAAESGTPTPAPQEGDTA